MYDDIHISLAEEEEFKLLYFFNDSKLDRFPQILDSRSRVIAKHLDSVPFTYPEDRAHQG